MLFAVTLEREDGGEQPDSRGQALQDSLLEGLEFGVRVCGREVQGLGPAACERGRGSVAERGARLRFPSPEKAEGPARGSSRGISDAPSPPGMGAAACDVVPETRSSQQMSTAALQAPTACGFHLSGPEPLRMPPVQVGETTVTWPPGPRGPSQAPSPETSRPGHTSLELRPVNSLGFPGTTSLEVQGLRFTSTAVRGPGLGCGGAEEGVQCWGETRGCRTGRKGGAEAGAALFPGLSPVPPTWAVNLLTAILSVSFPPFPAPRGPFSCSGRAALAALSTASKLGHLLSVCIRNRLNAYQLSS